MRRWTRGWKTFCLTLMVLTSFCMGVGVSQGLEAREVTAQLRPDFVIVIDQETAHFSDVNGSEVYPLLYEGTTYLPLRAIGNLMGKQVDWDEQSKTVTLSDALRESVGVERVVDGDTLEVLWRGNLEKVRLIGVDTAESVHPVWTAALLCLFGWGDVQRAAAGRGHGGGVDLAAQCQIR